MKCLIMFSFLCLSKCSDDINSVHKRSDKAIVSLMSKMMDSLLACNTELQKKVTKLEEKTEKQTRIMKRIKTDVTNLQTGFRGVKNRGKGPAFSAKFKHGGYMKFAKGQILKFDSVYLNRKNGYNPNTGYYTVPWSGVYLVTSTVRSLGGRHLHVFLWVNNHQIALAYGGNGNSGSLQIVQFLRKGDTLCLKNDVGSYVKNEEILGAAASTFSVVYLSK